MNTKISICLAVYITALLASNTLGIKLLPFLFGGSISVAIFFFPIVFLMTDVISEVYGRETGRMFVRCGFYSTAIFTFFVFIAGILPAGPRFEINNSFNDVFSLSSRFLIASFIAYAIGEFQDVKLFNYLKIKFHKFFLFRSFLSNLWSQFLDSALWFSIAYGGLMPVSTILSIMIPWWLYKVGMGLVYSPLALLGVKILKYESEGNKN